MSGTDRLTLRATAKIVLLGSLVVALGIVACATPVQQVRLDVGPAPVAVFVDGERQASAPDQLQLRSDRAHVLLFQREGYRPERVVLHSRNEGGTHRLEPSSVHVRLAPLVPTQRDVLIEQDDS